MKQALLTFLLIASCFSLGHWFGSRRPTEVSIRLKERDNHWWISEVRNSTPMLMTNFTFELVDSNRIILFKH